VVAPKLAPLGISDEDRALVAEAYEELRSYFVEGWHHVAAALRMRSGRVVTAMHLEATVGRVAVCAEAIALGKALRDERDLDTIVAVHYTDDSRTTMGLIAPCGMCRELLTDYGNDVLVIIPKGDAMIKVRMLDLIPEKYGKH